MSGETPAPTSAIGPALRQRSATFFTDYGMGSPGLDELRWLRPVRPGDTIRCEVEVIEARPSGSKPDRGTLLLTFKIRDQRDEDVLSMRLMQLTRRRPGSGFTTPPQA